MAHSNVSQYHLADWAHHVQPSAMQNSVSFAGNPDFISLALGLPDCSLLQKTNFERAVQTAVNTLPAALQYQKPLMDLKKHIVKLMKLRGTNCKVEEIFLTSGAQQGISLLTRLFLNLRDRVAVECYAYPGFLQAVEPFQPTFCALNTDLYSGIDCEMLERALQSDPAPKLVYVVPSGSNPQAVTISLEKKMRLAALADQYRTPIIEDDPYGFLNYDDEASCNLCVQSFNSKYVFYVGSFSKLVAPTLRVGWIVAPESLHQHLGILKEGSDINIGTFSQHVVSAYCDQNDLETHIQFLNQVYKIRRNAMADAIKKYFPESCEFSMPSSGLFFWIKMPKEIDVSRLYQHCLSHYGVAFIPGSAFQIPGENMQSQFARFNFSVNTEQKIDEGMQRIGRAIQDLIIKN